MPNSYAVRKVQAPPQHAPIFGKPATAERAAFSFEIGQSPRQQNANALGLRNLATGNSSDTRTKPP